ncbi:hypothetical protein Sango_2303000 [Sesamum angolense]|uniref:Uncharacterized protein n=1 Tax=Sesamum angolense TaxID=2727404 RepID=A0AAE2BLF2_9LAMI|nr:hypothetical protein Sango_2303000 [Sesamum angolense]
MKDLEKSWSKALWIGFQKLLGAMELSSRLLLFHIWALRTRPHFKGYAMIDPNIALCSRLSKLEVEDSDDLAHGIQVEAHMEDTSLLRLSVFSHVKKALCAKMKLGFIDGTSTKPCVTDPFFEKWICVESMVTWIWNCISTEIVGSFIDVVFNEIVFPFESNAALPVPDSGPSSFPDLPAHDDDDVSQPTIPESTPSSSSSHSQLPIATSDLPTSYHTPTSASQTSMTKKQATVSRSSIETEYRGMGAVLCELLWLSYLLRSLHIPFSTPVSFWYDNKAAIHITANPVFHECTKHLDIDCHLVHDQFKLGFIKPSHVPGREQLADLFTKPSSVGDFARLFGKLGLASQAPS